MRPGHGGERDKVEGRSPSGDPLAGKDGIAGTYGQKTLTALVEIIRLSDIGARLAERGHAWFVSDPENVPGLAAESLIMKIGENVSRVSAEFEADHPEVPWRVIKDMRNRLAHYYETTDYEVVWTTIESDFQTINAMVRGLLGQPNDPE